MSWPSTIEYAQISKRPSTTVTWESRTVRDGYFSAFKEQRRSKTVTVTETVEEARAVEASAAMAAAKSTFTGDENNNTLEVVSAQRSNDANGFMVTRTTTQSITVLSEWVDV